jgi:hypothetical protein
VLPVANGGTNTGTAPSSAQILVAQNSTTYAPETLSGDVSVATSGASTIANNAVTNAKAAQGAALTMKGNLTNASANLTDNALAPNQFHVCNNAGTAIVAAAMSGDVSNSAGAVTLATVNSNVGSFTNANITVNGKGLVTAASNGSGGGGLPSGVNPQTVYYATSGTTGTAVYASQIALLGTGADGATTYSTTATLTKPVYNQTAVKINSGVTMTVSGPTLIVASGAAQIGVSTFDIEGSLVGDGLGGNAGKLGASIFQLPGGPCPGQSNIYAQNSGSSPAGAGGGCGGYGGGSGSGSAEVAGGASLCANTSTFYPPPGAQGSGGGYGGQYNAPVNGGAGGAAIRIVVGHNSAATNDFINNGTISAVGLPGSNGGANSVGGGGGGSGGIATIYGVLSAILNNAASVTLTGGAGGVGGIASDAGNGGGGGGGGIYSMISTGARTLGTSTLTGGAGGTVLGTGTAGSAGSAGFAFSIAEDPTIPLIGWYDTHVRDVANLLHRPEGSTICMKDGELMNLMAAHIAATEHKDYGVVLSWLREQNPADALTATQDQLDHALDNVKTLAPQVEPCDLETSLLPAA